MQKRMLGLLFLAVMSAVVFWSGCGKKEEVLATVGDQKVTLMEFNQALANLPDNYKILATTYKGKHQILDNLVKKCLLVQEAQDRGYGKDPELQKKIKENQAKNRERLKQDLEEIQHQLEASDKQVYENVLLTEFNTRIKKETAEDNEIGDADIQAYYDDYTNKLKILNPAAKVPELKTVSAQIHAILVEEKLIKDLEKKHKVALEEEKFQKLFGDGTDVTIEDAGGK